MDLTRLTFSSGRARVARASAHDDYHSRVACEMAEIDYMPSDYPVQRKACGGKRNVQMRVRRMDAQQLRFLEASVAIT
ncbi:hypothetical protein EVAR_49845_1 [Eumeta japonica]|uniref:Uncharacterized protein n=1 Tax=Eumeta variegata TaxID=151549 RepID=A0A4C1Z1G4_EUMVA|nr:hypothetical protein EVAR_49845_1 [Eumeta japonica]